MSALLERRGQEAATIAAAVLDWTPTHCPTIWWGEGRKDGSCFVGISHEGVNYFPFAIWTYGRIQLQFQVLRQRGVAQELVETLVSALNQLPGVHIPQDALNRFPSFEMTLLKDSDTLARFLKAIEAFVEQIRTTSPTVS